MLEEHAELLGRVEAYRELEAQPNFFDHAYSELSHETVLAYSLDAYARTLVPTQTSADAGTERFGRLLLEAALGRKIERAHAVQVHRQVGRGNLRPDLVVHLTEAGGDSWIVIETKLHAPESSSQLEAYRAALHADAGPAAGDAVRLVLYKTGEVYRYAFGHDVVALTAPVILELLDDATRADSASWILSEYRGWIRKQVLRDELFANPDFQDWLFEPGGAPEHLAAWLAAKRQDRTVKRRALWHLLVRLGALLTGQPRETVRRYVHTDWNRPGDSAWSHLAFARIWHDDAWSALFYRVDYKEVTAWLDLRIYGGPPRGQDTQEKAFWVGLKQQFAAQFRPRIADGNLGAYLDLPGYRHYRLQDSATETSLCRLWLPPHPKGISPSALDVLFPELHRVVSEAIKATPSLKERLSYTEPFLDTETNDPSGAVVA